MATELTMPQMGFDMQEGTVVRWLIEEGSEVSVGEAIAEIETDKAIVEFESYASGILHRIIVPEGTTAPVGQPIAIVGAEGEEVPEPEPSPDTAPPVSEVEEPPEPGPIIEVPAPPAETPTAPPLEVRASPVARRLAQERGIDLSEVPATGPGGRITRDDVLAFTPAPEAPKAAVPMPPAREADLPAAPAVPAVSADRLPLSRMRQQIARVTVQSKRDKPHFYVSSEIDMTRAMELRRQVNEALEGEGVRVTVNDLVVKGCVEALKKYSKFNAFLHDDGIEVNETINVGVAIAEEEGLIVPAIMDCAGKSLKDIAAASKDLADRARSGTLSPREYAGGTFAVSNLGMFDVTSFAAIIQPPQSAVLAVGAVAERPVARDGRIIVAQTMTATLSADHRIVDGAEGARFIIEVKRLLENPIVLLGIGL